MRAKIDQIVTRFSNRSLLVQLLYIIALAVVVRSIYWIIAPEAKAGDSHAYLHLAQAIIDGEIAEVLTFPFHIIYSLLLVPGLIFHDGLLWYIPLLHISLSTISVVFLFLISREISRDNRVHLITAFTGVFYPYLLHWMTYILSEVAFVSVLLIVVYLTLKILQGCRKHIWFLWLVFLVVLLFTRPVAFLVLIVSGVFVFANWVRKKFPTRWQWITSGFLFAVIVISVMVLSIPFVNQWVFDLHIVAESLWLSTRVESGTFEAYRNAELPPEASGLSASELREYKKNMSITFIKNQPFSYILMAIQRFFNYFYPWVHPQWSVKHRLFDAVLSLWFTIAAFASLKAPVKKNFVLFLFANVLALGVTTAFSQIDTDGRFRLPAEVLLIPSSCVGTVYAANKLKEKFASWRSV